MGSEMCIRDSLKAVHSLEEHRESLMVPALLEMNDEALIEQLHHIDNERIYAVAAAIYNGIPLETIHAITKIDYWFLYKIQSITDMEKKLRSGVSDKETLLKAKQMGFLDSVIAKDIGITPAAVKNMRKMWGIQPAFSVVDTCAAEFRAQTPYYYSDYGVENEVDPSCDRKKVLVLGSGPIRIGQGIEFDYCSVHCVWALKKAGCETVIVNNNPETVSTDFNTADRLYFEPLTPEDVGDIIRVENPVGAVVAFGGQTAIRLTKWLSENNVPILGTPADSIDAAEDRGRFEALLKQLHIKQPVGDTVHTAEEAIETANRLGYPVLLRPSYVLGGQNMIIAFSDADVKEYMDIILSHMEGNLVLIDKYMMGTELEVDAICDGEDVLLPGIMEHIDRAGIHSGDSIAVYPAWNLSPAKTAKLVDYSTRLALALNTKGLINIQYVICQDQVYVIEVNPRSSRTVPYLSKVTGIPMVDIATRVMLGEKLKDMPYGTGLAPVSSYTAIKVPVFSFEKLSGLDTQLGPEMKSTGEVLGIAPTMREALYKGLVGAGYQLTDKGGIFITVRDTDKDEIPDIAQRFADLGFHLYATAGTAAVLRDHGMSVTLVHKISESEHNTIALLESGKVNYIISTSKKGRTPARDSVKVRRKSVELGIPCLTSLDTAVALADILKSGFTPDTAELVDICTLQK